MTADLPLLLYLAPLVGALFLGLAWWAKRRRVEAALAWSPDLGLAARRAGRLGSWILGGVTVLGAIGVAGPRWGAANLETESRSLNLVIAVDISRSMLAEDVQPNRLLRALREARRLVQDARGDRLALLAFSGRSYILTPLTLDDGAVSLQLDALDPEIASEGGTELGAVLAQGGQLLAAASEGGARAMVLFTDGEAHDSLARVLAAARTLRSAGVTLVVAAEGGVTPMRIPLRDPSGALIEYQTEPGGGQVLTQRRDDILRAVTDAAEGMLVPADLPDQAGAIWKTVAGFERETARSRRTEDSVPRAWIFGLAAGLLLLIHSLTRRGAALAGLAALLLLPPGATAQRSPSADRLLRSGDSLRAAEAFIRDARLGFAVDTNWYNAGTVALASGKLDAARDGLTAALSSFDPDVRFRTLYNLGLAGLRAARTDSARREALEREAGERFREALLLAPNSFAAKWNLELVSRRRPPPPSRSGGGSSPRPQGSGPREPPPPATAGLSRAEAEQILSSVERAERSVRSDQLRRRRVAHSATVKDW